MASNNQTLHVVMYPWFAYGHMIPFLHLSNKLAECGHKVTYILPPKALTRLRTLNMHPAKITFVTITVPQNPNLPLGTENAADFSDTMLNTHLATSMDKTRPEFESIVRSIGCDVMMYDVAYWVPEVAETVGAKSVAYNVVSAASVSLGKTVADRMGITDKGLTEDEKNNKAAQYPQFFQLFGPFGEGGQGFTPHIINVAPGEDVGQKIILFMQQTKRELCILSASGSIASAALRQPATSGGNIAYQGRFDIISLTGSYVRSDLGGKAGGLSACLAAENGQIVGGGVCGPLIAAGPVEVIVATFLINPKRDTSGGFKSDIFGSTMASPVSAPTASYRPVLESPGGFRLTVNEDNQNVDGNAFILQSQWRSGLNYDLTGNTGHDSHDSPENGDYEHLPD